MARTSQSIPFRRQEQVPDFWEAGFDGPFQVSNDGLYSRRADRVLKVDAHGRQHVLWPQVHGADGVDAPNGATLHRLRIDQFSYPSTTSALAASPINRLMVSRLMKADTPASTQPMAIDAAASPANQPS